MYYVVDKNQDERTYHLGDKMSSKDQYSMAIDVVYVQADGHELDRIKELFNGTLPCTTGRVVRWGGALAQTVHLAMIGGAEFGA